MRTESWQQPIAAWWGAGMAVSVAALLLLPSGASAGNETPRRPDLVVASLSEPPQRARPGDRFTVEEVTANEGRRRAAASETVVRLVRRAWRGTRAVPALRKGAWSSGRFEVAIPTSIDDGEYRLVACADARRDVRESDERNNCSSSTGALVIDTAPPAAPSLESHPDAVSAESSATFAFSSPEDVDFACRLDDAAPAPCESPHHVTGLGEGPHRFEVTARDSAGNEGKPATFTWSVDLTPPAAPSIDGSPSPVTLGGDASFAFSSTEDVFFVCALDGEPLAPCTSPTEYAGLADGEHAFQVRARDAAGNQSAPAELTWRVIPDEMTLGDGAWSWFADPRAVHHQGVHRRTYVGWVARDGDVKVSAYDHDTLTRTTAQIAARVHVDDHANPAIQILPDGRVRAYYSAHGGARMWYRTSLAPENVSAWGPAVAMPANTTATPDRGFTYPNPIHLASEGRTFLFWRGGNYKPTFATQAEGSETWTDVQTLISDGPASTARPYAKYDTDGSTIHVAFTNAHPNESSDVNIYYAAYRDGALRRADGTPIGTLQQPIAPREAELIYDTPHNAWIHDIGHDDQGRPVLVYAAFAPNPDPNRDARHRFIHRYFYSRWTGEQWVTWPITVAGGSIADDAREPYYSGGITLDHEDPRTVYLSREVGVFEVETWSTPDGGETWTSEAVTAASDTRNVRPVSPRGMLPFSGDMSVLWMRGAYPYYVTYQTSITTILRTGGNAPPVADATTSARTGLALHDMGFDGRLSHDPDGTIAEYHWDFGDGGQATGPQVSHAYQSAGRYFASLTVTDSSGARDTYVAEVLIDPAVATGPALDVAGDTATLHGAVTPHQATTYHFEYGTEALNARTADQALTGSGTAGIDVEAALSALTPGAVYRYRLVATNANGTTAGSVRTFTAGAPAGPGHYREVVLGTPRLAGYWRLGEASGLVAADERAVNAGTYAPSGVTLGQAGALRGDPDTAAAFDGATGEMSAPTPDLSTAGTLEGWFHWQTGVAVMRDHTSASLTGWILAYDSGGATPRIACRAGGTALVSSKPVAQVRDGWHHFALTRNGEDVRLYLDGVRLEVPATSPGTGVSAPPWHVMRNGGTAQYTRGGADEVAVYDRALTAADIRQRVALGPRG